MAQRQVRRDQHQRLTSPAQDPVDPGMLVLSSLAGAACELVRDELGDEITRQRALRDRLEQRLRDGCPDLVVHGDPVQRLPNTLSVALPGVDASGLLSDLGDEVAASLGAACHADQVKVSHVLHAMGVDTATAASTTSRGMPITAAFM